MAESQRCEKVLQVLTVLMLTILDVLFKPVVLEVYIRDARRVLIFLRVIFAVLKLPRTETLELHHVLCECARFVAENVVHHSEFLV